MMNEQEKTLQHLQDELGMTTERLICHVMECLQTSLAMVEEKEQYYNSDEFMKIMFLKVCYYLDVHKLLNDFDWSVEARSFVEYINKQNQHENN